ncbi:unnamed protein product [Sphagnum balticum]
MSQQLRFLSPRTFSRLHHRFAFISLPAFPLSVSHARTEVRFQSKFQSNNVVAVSSDNVDPQKLQVQLEGVQKMRVGAIKKELDALGVAYGDCFEKDELVRRLATVYITKENRAPVAAADRILDKAIAHISMRKLKSTVASPKEYLLVPLTIGNQGPFDFLLDTGSSTTLISPFIAHGKLGIPRGSGEMSRGLGGMGDRGIETREVLLPPIVLEGYSCKPVKGVIMDLANTGLSPSIAGIMGLNILAQFDVEFDFPNEQISFYEAGAAAKGDCNMEGMQKLVMSFGQYSLPGLKKPRLVVLGSGWGACRLLKDINMRLYDVVCVSPRNHMVFTPLLASTCVGTLEFRSVAEPVRSIQPALSISPDSNYFLARCTAINTQKHEVHCEALRDDAAHDQEVSGKEFTVAYDKLVIATGAEASTFGIKGVHEHAIFLRDVKNAMDIRSKLLLNLMKCEIPGTSVEEKSRLLHCVVVGGGPTGVEFSGELSDFIRHDVHRKFAHVRDLIHVTLIEANEILSSFDVRLREYAVKQLTKTGVKLKRGMVNDVLPEKLLLTDGTEVPYGLLVWSTGVGPSPFVRNLQFEKSPAGRIGVDETLRVPGVEDVYAIGDCSGYLERTNKSVLPALAQVAERQGKYIAKALNKLAKEGEGHAGAHRTPADPFVYRHLGSMATVGRYKALVDVRESNKSKGLSLTGFLSWLIWRSAYLTRVVSWRNRLYVAVNWGTTFLFGRDISRF